MLYANLMIIKETLLLVLCPCPSFRAQEGHSWWAPGGCKLKRITEEFASWTP